MTLEEFDAALGDLFLDGKVPKGLKAAEKARDLYRAALERGEQLEQDCREANEQWESERDRADEMELCSTTARFQRDAARAGLREIKEYGLLKNHRVVEIAVQALAESEGGKDAEQVER